MTLKIISGGQTGVDRAALDIAIKLGIEHGGWCPKGRRCESTIDPIASDTIPDHYRLKETETADYSERTKLNIRDSDATLILIPGKNTIITDGTILTRQELNLKNKRFLEIDLMNSPDMQTILNWIISNNIKVLNIAGPRESQYPGVYRLSCEFLEKLLSLSLSPKNIISPRMR